MIFQELGNPSTGRNATQGVEVNGPASCERIVSSFFSGELGVD